jgi:hypothetical protein
MEDWEQVSKITKPKSIPGHEEDGLAHGALSSTIEVNTFGGTDGGGRKRPLVGHRLITL